MADAGAFRKEWLRAFFFYGNNWLSLFGGAITTAAAMVLIGFWVVSVLGRGGSSNPYLGIIFELILPAVFVGGLVIILAGILTRRSYLVATDQVPSFFPEISIHDPVFRHGLDIVVIATLINFVIVGTACYRGVAYMDTVSFCGSSCHVMAPENAAYHISSHAGVACTQCHVAPGPAGYIHAKVNGTKQLLEVVFRDYPKPIMAENKVPAAAATCLGCHNPASFVGDRLRVSSARGDDEENSETSSLTMIHVGGQDSLGRLSGIHGAHMSKIEYIATDSTDQTISWIGKTEADGSVTEFMPGGVKGANAGQRRTMDCIDCHNSVGHAFSTPEDALNRDMALGSPSATLPFIHKEGLTLLKANYGSGESASQQIEEKLITFYRSQYPAVWNSQQSQINLAAKSLATIYRSNVFQSMKVDWGTHPDNIGHNNSPGCFRCHDGNHTSAAGKTITNDCSACHNLLVSGEIKPKLLGDLGLQ
jgi:nitrate/TMAO reductase-like tetraheme cytochrome c subunit